MMVNADGLLVVKVAALICLQITGATGSDPGTQIKGGLDAQRGQFPWQVQLFGKYSVLGPEQFLCGGSIIDVSWVLTAGHCIKGTYLKMVFGSQRFYNSGTLEPGSFVDTSETIFLHEDYQKINATNEHNFVVMHDIALIRLKEPLTLSDVIQPVKLPRRSHRTKTFEGETMIASGWGHTEFGGSSAEKLQYVDLVMSRDSLFRNCTAYNFICSKGTDKSALSGDSGGPLVWRDEVGEFVQIGVFSQFTLTTDKKFYSSAFTFVPYYLDWIGKITGIKIAD